MQTRQFTLVPRLALPVMLMLFVVQVLVFVQAAYARAGDLEGTWLVDLTPSDCQTGEPAGPTAQFLYTFVPGGSLVQTSNRLFFRSPAHGIWKHTTEQNFLATLILFRYNPDGTPSGRSDITEHMELGEGANEYTGTVVAEVSDVDGNLSFIACSTTIGHRLTFSE
jgi:hypothetical protein